MGLKNDLKKYKRLTEHTVNFEKSRIANARKTIEKRQKLISEIRNEIKAEKNELNALQVPEAYTFKIKFGQEIFNLIKTDDDVWIDEQENFNFVCETVKTLMVEKVFFFAITFKNGIILKMSDYIGDYEMNVKYYWDPKLKCYKNSSDNRVTAKYLM